MNSPTFGPICGPNIKFIRKKIFENLDSEPNKNDISFFDHNPMTNYRHNNQHKL